MWFHLAAYKVKPQVEEKLWCFNLGVQVNFERFSTLFGLSWQSPPHFGSFLVLDWWSCLKRFRPTQRHLIYVVVIQSDCSSRSLTETRERYTHGMTWPHVALTHDAAHTPISLRTILIILWLRRQHLRWLGFFTIKWHLLQFQIKFKGKNRHGQRVGLVWMKESLPFPFAFIGIFASLT